MGKVKAWLMELQDMNSTGPCPVCNGEGQVEVFLAADCFREEDCDNCDGSGEIELEDEDGNV